MPLFNIQPTLENETVLLRPLQPQDLDALYAVASDPNIWEQHPQKDRWKKEVFLTFFEGAVQSKGAFIIIDKATNTMAGSTRFYDYSEQENCIHIGYTFYATRYWGKGVNRAVKTMMLDYIFQFVSRVAFHVGIHNLRSQIAMGRVGAKKIGEQEVAYFGEASKMNVVYGITKDEWLLLKEKA
jgi:RimJ/RimL family protein N-acetyltransferase